MAASNVELLASMAQALGPLREKMAFLGGCATSLLITDAAASPVRATEDVDAICAIASTAEYHRVGETLRKLGFAQTIEGSEPPYRWTRAGPSVGASTIKLDLMPIDEAVLGFSNRWYATAYATAVPVTLGRGIDIRLVNAPCFLATKLEAFLDRGKGDYLSSHDLEDVLSVVDGRAELVEELHAAKPALRQFVAGVFAGLLADQGFVDALPGLIVDGNDVARTTIVLERLRVMAG
jgi:predicted nucleotidyltransferase